MFEDSTFESTGRIRTGSRRWMIATFFLNGSILLALVLIPLIYPQAIPKFSDPFLVEVPPPPPMQQAPPPPPPQRLSQAAQSTSEMMDQQVTAPRQLPTTIAMVNDAGEPPRGATGIWDDHLGLGSGAGSFPGGKGGAPAVVLQKTGPVRLSTGIAAGLLIGKTLPVYPAIARATRTEGTVVVQATISKTGIIENLRVVSGPPLLQQAALDAVKNWLYKPYLLNGEPVEVETTVNVVFTIGR